MGVQLVCLSLSVQLNSRDGLLSSKASTSPQFKALNPVLSQIVLFFSLNSTVQLICKAPEACVYVFVCAVGGDWWLEIIVPSYMECVVQS